jgi:hypothetical protein
MGLIKEPKNIDFSSESKPWSEEELYDFRKLMKELKSNNINTKVIQKTGIRVNNTLRKKVIA